MDTKSNSAVCKVLADCVFFRKRNAPAQEQLMSELSKQGVTSNKSPISSASFDLFGPVLSQTNRSKTKQYGVIFTCIAVRAINIKIAYSLDTSFFIQASRRSVARKGLVTQIIFDKGKNLVGSEREFRKAVKSWNSAQIHNFLMQKGIDWFFNPPGGSHYGGIFERQIRSIRKYLSTICQGQLLTDK